MLRHVDQPFRVQDAGVDKILVGHAAIRYQFRPEQIDPPAVWRMRDLPRIAAITAEEAAVARHVEMDRPLVALEMIPGAFSRADVVARQPENLATGPLQVIPDGA